MNNRVQLSLKQFKWIELFEQQLLNECKWKRDDSQI